MFELDRVAVHLAGKPVLRDVSFRAGPGERVVVLGVNGCGKTTLLRLLDGLLFPAAGEVRWAGEALAPRRLEDPAFRRRFRADVGLLFQNVDSMLFNPTVADEIAFGPRQLGLPDVGARVSRWAAALEVAELLPRPPFELSGGEKKRVALAALLANDPKALLLDEPTAGLDPTTAAQVVELIAGLAGVTVLVATHNLSMAAELGDRAILLARDREGVLFDGPVAEVLGSHGLLVESGLAHRHAHRHGSHLHAHYHVHDLD